MQRNSTSITRTVLVTAAPGAGSAATAAGLALVAARNGRKSLVVDTTAQDRFGRQAHEPTELAEGLYGVGLDPARHAAEVWPLLRGRVGAVLDEFGLELPEIEDVLLLDAANRLLTLLQLRDLLQENRWDAVFVDLGPARGALPMLGLPELLSFQLDRLLPTGRRVERAVRAGGNGVPDPLLASLPHLSAELAALRTLLAPATAYVALPADSAAIPAGRAAMAGLSLLGHRVAGVVLTGLVPDGPGDWLRRTARAQAQAVRAVGEELLGTGAEVLAVRDPGGVPTPQQEAVAIGADLFAAGHDPLDVPPSNGAEIVPAGTDFELRLALPFSQRGQLQASRHGDDLVLAVGGHRRIIRLASGLRRCTVAGARLRDGVLVLRFTPDPALWRGLR